MMANAGLAIKGVVVQRARGSGATTTVGLAFEGRCVSGYVLPANAFEDFANAHVPLVSTICQTHILMPRFA